MRITRINVIALSSFRAFGQELRLTMRIPVVALSGAAAELFSVSADRTPDRLLDC